MFSSSISQSQRIKKWTTTHWKRENRHGKLSPLRLTLAAWIKNRFIVKRSNVCLCSRSRFRACDRVRWFALIFWQRQRMIGFIEQLTALEHYATILHTNENSKAKRAASLHKHNHMLRQMIWWLGAKNKAKNAANHFSRGSLAQFLRDEREKKNEVLTHQTEK